MYIFQCEDTVDGIFTGVYDAWDSRLGHKNIQLSSVRDENLSLFSEYIPVQTDFGKSQRVSRTLIRRLGAGFCETVCSCAMADQTCRKLPMDKANAIYQAIVLALFHPGGAKVLSHISEPCISCIFELRRQTRNEAHHLLEFLRFAELKNGILFAKIHPNNNVLPILADHFTNRLPLENFIIYDAVHQTAAVHSASKDYLIADAPSLNFGLTRDFSPEEETFQRLWHTFFETVAIEARVNPRLQIQNIPKRFWADTVELREKL